MASRKVHSRLLATLDQEIEKMNFGGANVVPTASDRRSNTMKMALGSAGDAGMRDHDSGPAVPQTPSPRFFPNTPNVISAVFSSSKKSTPTYTDSETQISTGHTTPKVQDILQQGTPDFPLYAYQSTSPVPVRHYVRDEAEADKLIARLRGPLGFDLEWRVLFRPKMIEQKTAVLQLCDERMILILQLTAMKYIPKNLKEIMGKQDVIKMGVNILNDGRKLQRDYGIISAGLLEMSHLARLVDPSRVTSKRMISLQRLVEMYTGCTLSKGAVRMSNWEARLNEEQLEYAANDAHSALRVYNELMLRARNAGMDLKPVVIPKGCSMGITFVSESSISLDRGAALKHPSRAVSPKVMSKAQNKLEPASDDRSLKKSPRFPSDVAHITSLEQLQASKMTNSKPVGGQFLRAYKLWHEEQLPLPEICSALRSSENPLTKGTVISYVVEALKADTSLPFSRDRLKELVQLEYGSSMRHGWWVASLDKGNRGLERPL